MDRLKFLGFDIDPVTTQEATVRVAALIAHGGMHQVVTLNPEYLYRAQTERDLGRILEQAALVTVDGIGLQWALRLSGLRVPERVTGIDLMLHICRRAVFEGWRVFLLGGRPGVAEGAATRLLQDLPGLRIVGAHHGYFSPEEEPAVIAKVKSAAPQLLFVGLGAPRQERWIHANRQTLAPLVAIGVGGSFDVVAGRVKRAPVWMRRLGLEWLGRLLREPWRWRRMLVLPLFALFVIRVRLFGR
jgi:N-acetylglucosaminyldiphosphoundecaprenol N-acetyl-beta-D-mannosaminyltransferase